MDRKVLVGLALAAFVAAFALSTAKGLSKTDDVIPLFI